MLQDTKSNMIKGAEFSTCGKYRYLLYRIWDASLPKAMCIGLNPSTADAMEDDPTISHLRNILQHAGYGGLYMTNVFALISPNPEDLRACPDPVKDNDLWLFATRAKCRDVIYCWGNFPMAAYRAKVITRLFPDGMCFGKSKSGAPFHPMALWRAGIKNKEATIKPFI